MTQNTEHFCVMIKSRKKFKFPQLEMPRGGRRKGAGGKRKGAGAPLNNSNSLGNKGGAAPLKNSNSLGNKERSCTWKYLFLVE